MTQINDQAITWKLYASPSTLAAAAAGNFGDICGFRITLRTQKDKAWAIDAEKYEDRWRPISTNVRHHWIPLEILSARVLLQTWGEHLVERKLACRIIAYLASQVGKITDPRLAAVVSEAIAEESLA